jgi:hypothetical protein
MNTTGLPPGKKGEVRTDKRGRLMVFQDAWREAEWRECHYCGVKFPFPIHNSAVKNRGRFCSTKCTSLYRAKLDKAKRPWKRCVVCKRQFEVGRPSHANRHQTCTDPGCRYAYKSMVMRKNWQKRRDALYR